MKKMARLMDRLAPQEGINETRIDGVRIFRTSEPQPRQPLCYNQGILIVGQGFKRVFLGGQVYEYNPDNYLVMSVPLPAECETHASRTEPLLLMFMDIDMGMLSRIIGQMDDHIDPALLKRRTTHQGLFLARATPEIKNPVIRLLQVLLSPVESKVIGPGILHEILFRIMCGENAAALYALAMKNTRLSRVDKALKQIHSNFRDPIDVDKLAGIVNMSPSAFHRAFKEVTASSPIQYLKKIRLDRARTLLAEQGIRVNEAALEVGYESSSQFSREFKRYFGNSPVSYIGKERGAELSN